jgi:UDP-N-acetylmuramate--alanine ligase
VQLNVPGKHNVVNALGAIVIADRLGIPFATYSEALRRFRNTKRRFEYYGERNGVKVFHDYGHHPSEIRATLDAATRVPHKRLYCVFQCNSYTRARTLFCSNVTCFMDADSVLVPDIYPGREKDTGVVHARGTWSPRSTKKAQTRSTFRRLRKSGCISTSTPNRAIWS